MTQWALTLEGGWYRYTVTSQEEAAHEPHVCADHSRVDHMGGAPSPRMEDDAGTPVAILLCYKSLQLHKAVHFVGMLPTPPHTTPPNSGHCQRNGLLYQTHPLIPASYFFEGSGLSPTDGCSYNLAACRTTTPSTISFNIMNTSAPRELQPFQHSTLLD